MLSTVFGYSTSATFLGNMLGPITGGFLSGMIGIRGLVHYRRDPVDSLGPCGSAMD